MTLIAGGECFDDADALRAGETDQVLGYWVAASSTLGTFLRSFSFGHARRLDVVSGKLLECAWSRGAGRGEPLHRCPLHDPRDLRAREAGRLEVHLQLRARLPPLDLDRRRPATSATRVYEAARVMRWRGAASFIKETVAGVRAAGATGEITIRADSDFYNHKVVASCRKADVRFPITVKVMGNALHNAFSTISQEDWTSIPYFMQGTAVAEISYTPFATKKGAQPMRLIVRRVPPTPGSQLALYTD